jgi:hypothetical protein
VLAAGGCVSHRHVKRVGVHFAYIEVCENKPHRVKNLTA